MKANGLVLVHPDTPDIDAEVNRMLDPYYVELEVEPHPDYYEDYNIAHWKEMFQTGSDLDALRQRLVVYLENEVFLDERGLYGLTTFNPRGQWDWWLYRHGERMMDEAAYAACLEKYGDSEEGAIPCNSCLVKDLHMRPEFKVSTVVTPDGVWHDIWDFGWRGPIDDMESNVQAWARWLEYFRAVLAQYADHLAIGIRYHH